MTEKTGWFRSLRKKTPTQSEKLQLLAAAVLAAPAAAFAGAGCGGEGQPDDWLVAGCSSHAVLTTTSTSATTTEPGSTTFSIANGIVAMELHHNESTGLIAATSIKMLAEDGATAEKLGSAASLGAFVVNDVAVLVGGVARATAADTRPRGRFVGPPRVSNQPVAGGFHFVPGDRGSNPNTAWPPKGIRAEFDVAFNCNEVAAGDGGTVVVTVVIEQYDETSGFGRRLQIDHNCTDALYVYNMSTITEPLRMDRSITYQCDAGVAKTQIITDAFKDRYYASTYVSATPTFPRRGPGLSDWKALDSDPSYEPFESFYTSQIVHDTPYTNVGTPFRGFGRYGLTEARMARTVSPQIEQNPIKAEAVCIGGNSSAGPPNGVAGSAGSWCYDDVGTAGLKRLIAQSIDAGVEILSVAQNMNNTWRSQVGSEFMTAANKTWFKSLVDVARAGGVEMGAYQLILNARSATAFNQAAPSSAAVVAASLNKGYDCLIPTEGLDTISSSSAGNASTCHVNGAQCALCGATVFYDQMDASMQEWWNVTGVTTADPDGAESGTPCSNASHAHHNGLNDTDWEQYKAMRKTTHWQLASPALRQNAGVGSDSSNISTSESITSMPTCGFISGMPGSFLEQGESKVCGGYSEMTFSLPRWTWIDRVRESIIHSPQGRDMTTPVGTRMFPLPLSAAYHPSEPDPTDPTKWKPVPGYTSAATISPMEEHLPEMEWALSQTWGTGAFPQLRGKTLWDGPKSEAMLKKWIAWAKKYRRVLSSETVTIANGTTCWGNGMAMESEDDERRDPMHRGLHYYDGGGSSGTSTSSLFAGDPSPTATCTSTFLDAVLHRAPKHFYDDIDERGLAMVWNPTSTNISTQLKAPLYYGGISKASGAAAAMLSHEGAAPTRVPLGLNDTILLPVNLGPRELTWFVITEA